MMDSTQFNIEDADQMAMWQQLDSKPVAPRIIPIVKIDRDKLDEALSLLDNLATMTRVEETLGVANTIAVNRMVGEIKRLLGEA